MKKVLVIEDDAPLGWLIGKILQEKYEVIWKNDGMEALSWLSEKNLPDLIISDIKMPSLNGIELLEMINSSALYGGIPVIMLSCFEDGQNRKQCLDLGALEYMVKPFQPQVLLEKVNNVLGSRETVVIN